MSPSSQLYIKNSRTLSFPVRYYPVVEISLEGYHLSGSISVCVLCILYNANAAVCQKFCTDIHWYNDHFVDALGLDECTHKGTFLLYI